MEIASAKLDYKIFSIPVFVGAVYCLYLVLKGEGANLLLLAVFLFGLSYLMFKKLGGTVGVRFDEVNEILEVQNRGEVLKLELNQIIKITDLGKSSWQRNMIQYSNYELEYKVHGEIRKTPFIIFTDNVKVKNNLKSLLYIIEIHQKEKRF